MYMQFILSVAILLVMMLFLLPYDIRWTAKLIRRDVRDLRRKYTTRLKHTFKPDEIPEGASLHQAKETERTMEVPEGVQHIDHSSALGCRGHELRT